MVTVSDIPKSAIIGAAGYIGRTLLEAHRRAHPDCIGTHHSERDTLHALDLRKPDLRPLRLAETGHRHALLLAAVPNINRCAVDAAATRAVNSDGIAEIARQLFDVNILPIFFSTDYVFEGARGPYADNAPLAPTTEYGRQKAEAERSIARLAAGRPFLILRLSKIFSLVRGDGTLLDDMGAALAAGREVRAAYNQTFCPTLLDDLISAVLSLQRQGATGVMNLCAPKAWRRYDLAATLANAMRARPEQVKRISLEDLGSPARPHDTSMSCRRFEEFAAMTFTPVEQCIEAVAANYRK